MKISNVVSALETIAPLHLAEDWDNVGLLIGDAQAGAKKLLLCVDLTERVLAEARSARADMVMAYHPVIFKPVARLTTAATPIAYAAARAGLAVYSMHTAWDAAPDGVNDVLADVLGMCDRRPLAPRARKDQCKVVVFAKPEDMSNVADAAFGAGAGRIGNYERCAFFAHGVGTFYSGPDAHPAVGVPGREEATEEMRLEIIAPKSAVAAVCEAIRGVHSYEEPAIDVYPLDDYPSGCGLGRVGRLDRAVSSQTLVNRVKKSLGMNRVWVAWRRSVSPCEDVGGGHGDTQRRHATRDGGRDSVGTVACCAGSCGSLVNAAMKAGAEFYLTGEMRHHEAVAAAASGMTVMCVGHSNSERPALARLAGRLVQMLPKLKVMLSKQDKDPFEIV